MREILFRGRGLSTGAWHYGYYGNCRCRDYITTCASHWIEVIPESVGQYTGLTDKNGKRIFEGDIVKGYNTFHHREEQYIVRYKVIGFFFCENENEWHPDYIEEMRVIGNIHDNPAMIGGKEDDK